MPVSLTFTPRARTLLVFLGLLSCIALAYCNIFHNAFLLDDEFLIQKNRFIKSFDYLGLLFTSSSTSGAAGIDSFYRPLQGLIYLIVYQLAGFSLPAFHLPNLLLHGVNACLMVGLGLRLGMTRVAAALAALIWALHPMHTEAVTYMSATADTLYTTFCLAGLVIMLPEFRAKSIGWACVFFVLGLMSKETALVFPLLAMACIYHKDANRFSITPYLKTWPLWLIALAYVILRMTILKLNGLDFYKTENIYTQHIWVRAFTFFATLPDYLSLMLWPEGLHFDRDFPLFMELSNPHVLAGAAIVILCGAYVGCSVITKNTSKTHLWITWALLWFAGAHALHTGLLIPVNAFFLEHWMYMPSIGLCMGIFHYAAQRIDNFRSTELKLICISGVILIAGVLGFATFRQNMVWATPIAFYSNILNHGVQKARVHNNIAMAYDEVGDIASAKSHYEQAIALDDHYAQTRYNLAMLLLRTSSDKDAQDQALAHLQRAIEINPDFFQGHKALSQIYTTRGETAKAKEHELKFLNLLKTYLQY